MKPQTVEQIAAEIYRQGDGFAATKKDLRDSMIFGAQRYHNRCALERIERYKDALVRYPTTAYLDLEMIEYHLATAEAWWKARQFVRDEGDR